MWSPQYLTCIDKLEKVQRYFTRRLYSRMHLPESSYADRFHFLKLEPLELRRLKFDLSMVYKCLHNQTDSCINFFQLSENTHTRGNKMKLIKPRFRTNVLNHCFSVRAIDVWNSLPDTVNSKPLIHAPNSKSFLQNLHNVNLSQFLTFNRNI